MATSQFSRSEGEVVRNPEPGANDEQECRVGGQPSWFSHHCVVPSLLARLGRVPGDPGLKAAVLCSLVTSLVNDVTG